jgi:molybdate transport system substrate-binding protein
MRTVLASALVVLIGLACGTPNEGPAREGPITIFAAASLTDAFKEIAASFGGQVRFNFAGTPTLVTQIEQGARADVFASADVANMDKLQADGLINGDAKVFAHNKLEIVVAPGNPKHIASLADLAKPGVIYISAGPTVPGGKYAAQALAKAGVKVAPKSLETDVKSVVSKVAIGEADAGIVYATDVDAARTRVTGVAIPDQYNVVATYPIAVVKDGADARAFVAYVLSEAGQKVLGSFGFQPA